VQLLSVRKVVTLLDGGWVQQLPAAVGKKEEPQFKFHCVPPFHIFEISVLQSADS